METGWRQEEMKDRDASGRLKAQGGDGWVCGEVCGRHQLLETLFAGLCK